MARAEPEKCTHVRLVCGKIDSKLNLPSLLKQREATEVGYGWN
jgi:hypothetical protein